MRTHGLMDDKEEQEFKERVRIRWERESLKDLEMMLAINQSLKQQYELRIEVMKEIIDGRTKPDSKTKQFSD